MFFFPLCLSKFSLKKNIWSSFLLAVNATGDNSRREIEEGRARKILAAFSFLKHCFQKSVEISSEPVEQNTAVAFLFFQISKTTEKIFSYWPK